MLWNSLDNNQCSCINITSCVEVKYCRYAALLLKPFFKRSNQSISDNSDVTIKRTLNYALMTIKTYQSILMSRLRGHLNTTLDKIMVPYDQTPRSPLDDTRDRLLSPKHASCRAQLSLRHEFKVFFDFACFPKLQQRQ